MTQGLQYEAMPGDQNSLSIHCDADWGTDPEDRLSGTGVVCRLGGNVVSWTSRKQSMPAVSSCEAEYAALFEAGRDAVWIRRLLCEVGQCPGEESTLIYYDSQGSILLADGVLSKVKHVELKYHFAQHLIQSGQTKVAYVPSEDNCADGLTKALAGSQVKKMCEGLYVVGSRGSVDDWRILRSSHANLASRCKLPRSEKSMCQQHRIA
jgi:hypothetical protein